MVRNFWLLQRHMAFAEPILAFPNGKDLAIDTPVKRQEVSGELFWRVSFCSYRAAPSLDRANGSPLFEK